MPPGYGQNIRAWRFRCYNPVVPSAETFLDLQRRTQENLTTFLEAEIDLADTMLKVMNTTRSEGHRVQLAKNIQAVIDTVHHFEGRVSDGEIRDNLHASADRLEQAIRGSLSKR